MLVIQAALWMHGGHVAADIARRTAEQARTTEGGHGAVGPPAGSILTDVDIAVERNAEEVRVRVTAQVLSLIPGVSWPVDHVSVAPVERFVPEGRTP